jgi:hypothetical protein
VVRSCGRCKVRLGGTGGWWWWKRLSGRIKDTGSYLLQGSACWVGSRESVGGGQETRCDFEERCLEGRPQAKLDLSHSDQVNNVICGCG